jgi:hypothetical protein
VGELTAKHEVSASGLSEAERIAVKQFGNKIDFDRDFAILEGDTGFVSCWFTGLPDA